MNNISNAIKWAIRNFFFITIAIFIIIYLWWFRLTPFVFLDDPTTAFVGGFILLIVYLAFSLALSLSKHVFLKAIFYFFNFIFLMVNVLYLEIHIPRIETSKKCNGETYYITYGAPLLDEQWTYVQVSKWKGLVYESHFWGYAPGSAANDIICDTNRKETHFIRNFSDPSTLIFIDGENPQGFYEYASARLKNSLYFLSEDWSIENCTNEQYWACDISVYTLYKCKSNYTDCNPLPITYTSGDVDFLELRADETTNEIILFEHYSGSDDETLIFTYGENSRCYVDGCTINSK
jgi:hypothetical protein